MKTSDIFSSVYGREYSDCSFQGVTIYTNVALGLICVKNQVSLCGNDTVMGKSLFEKWFWDQSSAEVSHYYGYDGIFIAGDYCKYCKQ